MITPLPGATPTKPGTATLPFFGVDAAIVDDEGKEVGRQRGRQARHPQAVAVDAAHDLGRQRSATRRHTGAKSRAATSPATARGATRTATSGSSAASTTCSMSRVIASAPPKSRARSSSHPAVAEAAVVGRPDELKGQAVVCFVTLEEGVRARPGTARRFADNTSAQVIGPVATPDDIRFRRRAARRRAPEKSCAACSSRSPPARRSRATPPRSKTFSVLAKLASAAED